MKMRQENSAMSTVVFSQNNMPILIIVISAQVVWRAQGFFLANNSPSHTPTQIMRRWKSHRNISGRWSPVS
eukprot:CAMPEP_0168856872 /NCGR_PEP_ID=MMETSP0727-20121128/15426_1 /TAXON_ID=265536 /ORGANISM="Amphiprora sp., Strain CCMP467" /LENGTH=70 /DNA_ID=CAMNT_0008911459 /DNA_START=62 /DNA_END=270 /DNA_ORIENTATION=+